MNHIPDKILEHSYLMPLESLLILLDNSLPKFLTQIENMDESIFSTLTTLSHYGAYYILIPLNEMMTIWLDEKPLEWWNHHFLNLPNGKILMQITESFHEKMLPHHCPWPSESKKDGIPLSHISSAMMYEILWESYAQNTDILLIPKASSNLCLLIPGLFLPLLKKNFLEMLEEYAFPCLIDTVENLEKCPIPNKILSAIVKRAVFYYSSELGVRYKSVISRMISPVMQYTQEEFSNLRPQSYAAILQEEMNHSFISFYLTQNWIEQLDILSQYIDKYMLQNPSSQFLKQCIPTLMQCAGRNSDSSDRLFSLLPSLSTHEKSNQIILLALYRALCVETGSYPSRLLEKINSIFAETGPLNILIEILNDIVNFYTRFTRELPLRFDQTAFHTLQETSTEKDKIFYMIYEAYLPSSRYGILADVKWLSDHLFSNEKVIIFLNRQLEQVKDTALNYSTRLLAAAQFRQLFNGMATHLYSEARLHLPPCLEILKIPLTCNSEGESPQDEIFHLYSYSQIKELTDLNNRLRDAMEKIPSFYTVMQFESLNPSSPQELMLSGLYDTLKGHDVLLDSHKQRLEKIELSQKAAAQSIQYVLTFLTKNNIAAHDMLIEAFVHDYSLSLEFSGILHDLLAEKKSLQPDCARALETLNQILESAISHPEDYEYKIRKDLLAEAVTDFCSCIPVLSQLTGAAQCIKKLQQIFNAGSQENT